jgi:peptide/nickel transport system permease protein/oligopeptide transport system permease protein
VTLRYVVRRSLHSLLLLLGVSVVVFLLVHFVPGDPATVLLGEQGTPERVAEVRRALELDRPLPAQYWRFVSRAVQGDFGQSIRAMRPVLPYVMERLPATLELSAGALLLSAGLGIPLGVLAAVRRRSVWDRLSLNLALLAQSAPSFWVGLLLIALFSVNLGVLPVSGRGTVRHLVLPSLTLAIFFLGLVVRLTRSGMLEVLSQDYVRTARAKGLAERLVVFRHALKNAMIPIVTVLGLQVGTLLGGAVVTETVFAWPGMGQLAVQAIYQRDYPVVQAIVLLLGAAFVLINWVVDLTYTFLDPRITHG